MKTDITLSYELVRDILGNCLVFCYKPFNVRLSFLVRMLILKVPHVLPMRDLLGLCRRKLHVQESLHMQLVMFLNENQNMYRSF